MSLPMFKPPSIGKEAKASQEAQRRAEAERTKALKEDQLIRTKGQLAGGGVRSLISSSGGGYGRNFF